MILWHVTTRRKLARYLERGAILPPVRAWKSLAAAERFSVQTGRRVILRLRYDRTFTPLEGHRGEAVRSDTPYTLDSL